MANSLAEQIAKRREEQKKRAAKRASERVSERVSEPKATTEAKQEEKKKDSDVGASATHLYERDPPRSQDEGGDNAQSEPSPDEEKEKGAPAQDGPVAGPMAGPTAEAQASQTPSAAQTQAKSARYKAQWEKEQATDPAIVLTEIADPTFHDKLTTQLRKYFKLLIEQWEQAGDEPELLLETKRDIVRLLYKLRSSKLSSDMLVSLGTISYHTQQRNFLKANEAYMKLSIGNVAWPLGVGGVHVHNQNAASMISGIERSQGASILIDDKVRRWVTAVKRLVTFVERTS